MKDLLGRDPDGDPLSFRVVHNAKYGFSEIKRDTDGKWKLFYTSLKKFTANDIIDFVSIDSFGRTSSLATITVRFGNRPPTAQPASITVSSGGSYSTYLFGDDPDGNDIRFVQVNGARNGTSEVKQDAQGKWRVYYISRAGYVGPDTVNFVAIDTFNRTSAITTVSVNVVGASGASTGGGSGNAS